MFNINFIKLYFKVKINIFKKINFPDFAVYA